MINLFVCRVYIHEHRFQNLRILKKNLLEKNENISKKLKTNIKFTKNLKLI